MCALQTATFVAHFPTTFITEEVYGRCVFCGSADGGISFTTSRCVWGVGGRVHIDLRYRPGSREADGGSKCGGEGCMHACLMEGWVHRFAADL